MERINVSYVIKKITRVENQKRVVFESLKTAVKEFPHKEENEIGWEAILRAEQKMTQYCDENIAVEIDEKPEVVEIAASIRKMFKSMKAAYMSNNKEVFEEMVLKILDIIYEVK